MIKLLRCWEAVPLVFFFSETKINFLFFCWSAIFFFPAFPTLLVFLYLGDKSIVTSALPAQVSGA